MYAALRIRRENAKFGETGTYYLEFFPVKIPSKGINDNCYDNVQFIL